MREKIVVVCDWLLWCWASVIYWLLCITTKTKFEVRGETKLSKNHWYLLIANHQSWADIVVIYSMFRNQIPMAKFFLKQQLLYVPFLGMACWALNMPFMKRHSTQYLLRNPDKRSDDLAATRKACEVFKCSPTTIVNFVEGTRFNPVKKPAGAHYEYLLLPKTAGIAHALDVMGDRFKTIIDVTIAYPKNKGSVFVNLLAGKVKHIVIDVEAVPVDDVLRGDYLNDKEFKQSFQKWLMQRWKIKDHKLKRIYQ